MRVISLDSETFRIGFQAIAPKLVCFSCAERRPEGITTFLRGNGDADCEGSLRALFTDPDVRLVLHGGAYDLTVMATSYPALEPLIWQALEDGRITDTKIREELLNLSTHGKLKSMFMPDGTAVAINYDLASLTLKWLGIDTSHLKEGDDIWRLNFHTLDGLRADQYPRDAADYAEGDAAHTLQVYEEQERAKEIEGSTETEFFQAACAFALRWITIAGMPTDPVRFEETKKMLAVELSEEKLGPLVEAGIMRAREPARPYARMQKRAVELMSEWGAQTDAATMEQWQPELEGAGILFKKEEPSGIKTEPLKTRVLATVLSTAFGDGIENYLGMNLEELEALAESSEVKYKKTDGGAVCTDSEVIDDVAPVDPVLKVYQHRQSLQKLVSTELPRMMWEGKLAPRVHFPYKVLLETGRTASKADELFPSGNGQQVHPAARPIFKGLFISTDFSTLELACVGQIMFEKFGFSVHRDKINAGYDLHAYLGTQLALRLSPDFRELVKSHGVNPDDPDDCYELFLAQKKDNPKFFKHWRNLAKPVGLGFPGGLGPYKIIGMAKKDYGVDFVSEAEKLFADKPELFNRSGGSVVYWAKKLYGFEKKDQTWTPTLKGVALAAMLRELWFETYPEMRLYLKEYLGRRGPKNWDPDAESERDTDFSYSSPFGMVRAGCDYCSAANGEAMQTPAAEGFKAACFHLVKECRLGRLKGLAQVVNEIHDETIVEVLAGEERLHDVAMIVKEVMEGSMAIVIKDVKIKANPAAMRRWHKEAEPVYVDGKLVPWEPKTAA
jgi:hypothetical protein